ncbi:hypothetical protein EI555_008127 [Monodon monoceros]|uniref:Peptidyl-prolyl cis-trans isomerase n=1 Tax=Monodon monoceros TaxID=40151 RepID=A0A4U1F4Z3_MONMO|nr:hypothetical protein EI555_008127 [Monodon monoceros]
MANSLQTPHEQPLQVKVVGLFKSSSFQIAKSAAEVTAKKQPQGREGPSRFRVVRLLVAGVESLKSNYPSKFEDPIIVPVQEFAWDQYLQEKKRVKDIWGQLFVLLSHKHCLMLYVVLLSTFEHDFVFLDISIDFYPIGRLIFELYCDTCPKTCKNFQILCTGKAGFSRSGIRLHYTGSIFHRVVRNGWIQGGGEFKSLNTT